MTLQSHVVDRALWLAAVEREMAHRRLPANQQCAEILAELEMTRLTLFEGACRRAPCCIEDSIALEGLIRDRRMHYRKPTPHEAELEALAVRQCWAWLWQQAEAVA